MTHQPSFSQAEVAAKKKVTRREKFLARMDTLIPWANLLAVIEPYYPKGERGRPPVGLERMLADLFQRDKSVIAAPPSTKNKEKKRDPRMHQTKKGNQWYFGMKAHIGADRDSKLVHTVVVTAANVADITQTAQLLHGEETQVHADAGYTGVEKRAEIVALERRIDWQVARKRGLIKAMAEGAEKAVLKASEKVRAGVRAFVEHPFHILKNLFGHRKVRYRGLAKNGHQLHTLFGLANVVIGARQASA